MVKLNQSGEECVLSISGDLTLAHADQIRSNLIKAIIDNERVIVEFGDVSAVDLSFLQLLCSAHRSAVRMNRQVAFAGQCPALVLQTIEDAGYARYAGCRVDPGESCLWAKRPDDPAGKGQEEK